MANHTPGPWTPKTRLPDLPGFTIEVNERDYCVAIIPKNKRSDSEVEANARLTAAAPDLLVALKKLRHEIVFDDEGDLTEPEFDAMLEEADAAIAKATA